MDTRRTAAWSCYWAEGNITSLPNLFRENYGGGILHFWNGVFSTVKDNSSVLDICTGNGAIAILLRENLDQRKIRCDIHAIDIAEIKPIDRGTGSPGTNRVRFHPGVAVEQTHFASGCFDLVVGQFALEYCNVQKGTKELARIIRGGGEIVLMLHHVDSVTVKNTQELISISDVLLREPTIFFRLRKYAEQQARRKTSRAPKLRQKRVQLLASFEEAKKLIRRFPNSRFLQLTLDKIKELAEGIDAGCAVLASDIRQFEKAVNYHAIRMRDLRDAALDNSRMAEIKKLFETYGFEPVEVEPYYLDGDLFAWVLRARRAATA